VKLAEFIVDGELHLGSFTADGVLVDITRAAARYGDETGPGSIQDALKTWDPSLDWLSRIERRALADSEPDGPVIIIPPSKAKFAPPVASPSKILCAFVNYRAHGSEKGSMPDEPVFFLKTTSCLVGDGDEVAVPRFSSKPDHEVELGVIIGKRGKDIEAPDAYDHVAGYTVINDISFRDGMKRGVADTALGVNLFKAKVADTSLPMGPFLVTRDEIPDPYPLELTLRVNGEVRQHGTTGDMLFKIPELMAAASEGNTLLPGDVIATGTCGGAGLFTGRFLNEGAKVEAEVERVGVLRNVIRRQPR
jgi:2-keto-4-pentenoate hydratase/2-oxohepta-3-ene-1,7-dioic acid hydratase in catechol pathway